MKINISTLSAELIAPTTGQTRIALAFGDAQITEWPVPAEDIDSVTGGGVYGYPSADDVREYVERFVANKLEALFQQP